VVPCVVGCNESCEAAASLGNCWLSCGGGLLGAALGEDMTIEWYREVHVDVGRTNTRHFRIVDKLKGSRRVLTHFDPFWEILTHPRWT
jgi:hypothetical protein